MVVDGWGMLCCFLFNVYFEPTHFHAGAGRIHKGTRFNLHDVVVDQAVVVDKLLLLPMLPFFQTRLCLSGARIH